MAEQMSNFAIKATEDRLVGELINNAIEEKLLMEFAFEAVLKSLLSGEQTEKKKTDPILVAPQETFKAANTAKFAEIDLSSPVAKASPVVTKVLTCPGKKDKPSLFKKYDFPKVQNRRMSSNNSSTDSLKPSQPKLRTSQTKIALCQPPTIKQQQQQILSQRKEMRQKLFSPQPSMIGSGLSNLPKSNGNTQPQQVRKSLFKSIPIQHAAPTKPV